MDSVQTEDKISDVGGRADVTAFEEIDHQRESRLRPSVEEPPELELKTLPNHLEYDFLVEGSKLPMSIVSSLSTEQIGRSIAL